MRRPPAGTEGHEMQSQHRLDAEFTPATSPRDWYFPEAVAAIETLLHEARLHGFGEGWDARQPEIDRLVDERDRYYRAAFDTPRDVRARFDRAAVEYDDKFFGRVS